MQLDIPSKFIRTDPIQFMHGRFSPYPGRPSGDMTLCNELLPELRILIRPSAQESRFDNRQRLCLPHRQDNTMNNPASPHAQASAETSTSTRRAAANATVDQYLLPAPVATPDQYLLAEPVTAAPAGGQLATTDYMGTVQDGTADAPTVRSPQSYTLVPSE